MDINKHGIINTGIHMCIYRDININIHIYGDIHIHININRNWHCSRI